jgi:alanine racemase
MPAVKANAYGHGVQWVAPWLEKWGASKLAVAHVEEALKVRRIGCRSPVLLLSACLPEERETVVKEGFEPVVSSCEEIGEWEALAGRCKKRVEVHLKLDTGMGRLGLWHEGAMEFFETAASCRWVKVAGVCSHFATADENRRLAKEQWNRLAKWIPVVRSTFPEAKIHMANSAALLGMAETHADGVRPGIALYGIAPSKEWQSRLRPVLTWKSRVSCLRVLRRGQTVSYGAEFRASRTMRVATLAVGYADGYRRAMQGKGYVLVGGQRCRLLGRVTMDQIMVDVSHVEGVGVGDVAVLLGPGWPVEKWAELLGTISYEIFTSIGDRVPRVAVG